MIKNILKQKPLIIFLKYLELNYAYEAALWLVYNNIGRMLNYFCMGIVIVILRDVISKEDTKK